jgi:Copper chaperone
MDLIIHTNDSSPAHCEEKIRQKLSEIPGVELVEVDAVRGTVHITGGDLDQMEIRDLIEGIGYHTDIAENE